MKHIPVLPRETLEGFTYPEGAPSGVIVDGTLGGGGHTEMLLKTFPQIKVLACDLDEAAINRAKDRLSDYVRARRLALHHGNFAHIVDNNVDKPPGFEPPWSGALLDLGYSSIQLEDPSYGLSFSAKGPLDMRLGRPPSGQTAWELIQACTDEELGEILAVYGEINGAMRLARRIRGAVRAGEIRDSTRSLADFLERVMPQARGGSRAQARALRSGRGSPGIHPATLVFQALRIAVNDELRNLDHFLRGVILNLRTGGRLAVITFHSLEDRLVKRWGQANASSMRAMTKKPVTAGETEISENPRSRSAKLRVYEKT